MPTVSTVIREQLKHMQMEISRKDPVISIHRRKKYYDRKLGKPDFSQTIAIT